MRLAIVARTALKKRITISTNGLELQAHFLYSRFVLYKKSMQQDNGSRANSKDELCDKLRDLILEKQDVKQEIREIEKKIVHTQNNVKQSE